MSGADDVVHKDEPSTCPFCGQTFENKEKLDAHKASIQTQSMSGLSVQTQYDRLAQDWRQVHNIMWGIPSVAVSIITGVILAAYQPQLVGWPRIIALGLGSIFLFAIMVEIIKKRLLMNAISARLQHLEKDNHVDPFVLTTEALLEELEKDDKKRKGKGPDDADPVYLLFKWSYARQYLGYVVFVAAIIVSVLTYWEFVKYFHYLGWEYLIGIIPVVTISVIIGIIRYRKSSLNETEIPASNFIESALSENSKIQVEWTHTLPPKTRARTYVIRSTKNFKDRISKSYLPWYKEGKGPYDTDAENYTVEDKTPTLTKEELKAYTQLLGSKVLVTIVYLPELNVRLVVDGCKRSCAIQNKINNGDEFPVIMVIECYGPNVTTLFPTDFKHIIRKFKNKNKNKNKKEGK